MAAHESTFDSNLRKFLDRVLENEVEATTIEDILGPNIDRYDDTPDFEVPIPPTVRQVDVSPGGLSQDEVQPSIGRPSHLSRSATFLSVLRRRLAQDADSNWRMPPTLPRRRLSAREEQARIEADQPAVYSRTIFVSDSERGQGEAADEDLEGSSEQEITQDDEINQVNQEQAENLGSDSYSGSTEDDNDDDDMFNTDWVEEQLTAEERMIREFERTAPRHPPIAMDLLGTTVPSLSSSLPLQPFPSSAPQTEGFAYEGSSKLGSHCAWDADRKCVIHEHMCPHRCSPHLHIHRCGHEVLSEWPVACSIRCARSPPLAQGPVLACECGACYTKYHQYMESMAIIGWGENLSRDGIFAPFRPVGISEMARDWRRAVAVHKKQFFRAMADEDLRDIARADPTGGELMEELQDRVIAAQEAYDEEVREIETQRADAALGATLALGEDSQTRSGWRRTRSASSVSDSEEELNASEAGPAPESVARTEPKSVVDLLAPFLPIHIIEAAIPRMWRLEVEAQDDDFQDAVAEFFLSEVQRIGPELAVLSDTDHDACQQRIQYIYSAVFREAQQAIRLQREIDSSTEDHNERISHICWIHRISMESHGFLDGHWLGVFTCTLQGINYENYLTNPATGHLVTPMWYDAPTETLRTTHILLNSRLPTGFHGLKNHPLFAWLCDLEDAGRSLYGLVPGQSLLCFYSPEDEYQQLRSGPNIIRHLEHVFRRSAFSWSNSLASRVVESIDKYLLSHVSNDYGKSMNITAWEENLREMQDVSQTEKGADDSFWWGFE